MLQAQDDRKSAAVTNSFALHADQSAVKLHKLACESYSNTQTALGMSFLVLYLLKYIKTVLSLLLPHVFLVDTAPSCFIKKQHI